MILSDSPFTLRAYPRKNISSDDLSRALGDVAIREKWQLQSLRADEGRLDEVFRSITLSDTVTTKELKK